MNAFAWTAVVMIALGALSLVLLAIAWILERLPRPAIVLAALVNAAGEILLCCAIGLLAAIAFYLGHLRERELSQAPDVAAISTR